MADEERRRAEPVPEGSRARGGAHDRSHLSPKRADEQDAPEPERLITPDEEAGMDIAELDEPPQAEGPRDT